MPPFPWQVRPIDFAGIFNAAANFRRMQMEEQRVSDAKSLDARQRTEQERTAREWQRAQHTLTTTGDLGKAVQHIHNPAAAQQFTKTGAQFLEQRKSRGDDLTLASTHVLRTAAKQFEDAQFDPAQAHRIAVDIRRAERQGRVRNGTMQQWLGAFKTGRQAQSQTIGPMVARAAQTGETVPEDAIAAPMRGAMQEMLQGMEVESAGLLEQKIQKGFQFTTPIGKAAVESFLTKNPELALHPQGRIAQAVLQHPEWEGHLADEKQRVEAAKVRAARAGASQIFTGDRQQVEKSQRGKLQGALLDDEEMISDIEFLDSLEPERFMTAGGRIKGKVLGALDFFVDLPKDSKEYITQGRSVIETTGAIFNKYRKFITGAAASEKELARLEEQMLNENLSPTIFRASMKRLYDKITRGMRIKRRVLREGISVEDIAETDQGRNFQRDVAPRLQELLGDRPNKQAISAAAKTALNEGFFGSQEEADEWEVGAINRLGGAGQ